MSYDLKESGTRIQMLRKQHLLTQEQLAERLNITPSNLGRIERGTRGLSIDLLIEVALFFGVSVDYILLGRELQTDGIKQQLRMVMAQMINIEQQL